MMWIWLLSANTRTAIVVKDIWHALNDLDVDSIEVTEIQRELAVLEIL